jgi:[Skp1-protein]-hydroxyproline N-acetylglucosaminyltransferase
MQTIYLSLCSYKDFECIHTLDNLFEMAEFPNRIVVGLIQQNDENDIYCTNDRFKSQIRRIDVPADKAKGPTIARNMAQSLFQNEDFFFQIDSHLRFVKHWDTKLIEMYKKIANKIGNDKVVLSHYTKAIEQYKEYLDNVDKSNADIHQNVPTICKSFFNERDMISFLGAHELKRKDYPIRNPYIAAGFIFAPNKFVKDVPIIPLSDIFVGEEILLSIQAFTNGYDVYTPNENIVFHKYTREGEPKFWDSKKYSSKQEQINHKLILDLINGKENELSKYLGNDRTLTQFFEFAGIDIKKKKVEKDFCEEVKESFNGEIGSRRDKYSLQQGRYRIFILLCIPFILIMLIIIAYLLAT